MVDDEPKAVVIAGHRRCRRRIEGPVEVRVGGARILCNPRQGAREDYGLTDSQPASLTQDEALVGRGRIERLQEKRTWAAGQVIAAGGGLSGKVYGAAWYG